MQWLPTVQPAGGGITVREVYRIRADVEHGNSGSPLITAGGQVIGVVNALSLLARATGYALTLPPVWAALAHMASSTASSGTASSSTASSGDGTRPQQLVPDRNLNVPARSPAFRSPSARPPTMKFPPIPAGLTKEHQP